MKPKVHSTPPLLLAVLQLLHMQQGSMTIKYAGIENLLIINKVDDSLLLQYDVNIRIKLAFYCYGVFVYLLQSSVALAGGLDL